MKKLIYLSIFCLLGTITINSCQSESYNLESNTQNLKLTSPNGKILAKNLNELEDFIMSTSKKEIKQVSFENVKYFESKKFSFAVIDYY